MTSEVTQADRELAERICWGRSEKEIAEVATLIARHRIESTRLTAQSGESDFAEAFDILADVHDALALTAEYSAGATVSSFVASSTQFARLRKFLHDRQYADPRSSGEGRIGAGEDALREALKPFAKAYDEAKVDQENGATNSAPQQYVRLYDFRRAAQVLNARQSGEGKRATHDVGEA